jgi:hypothetical protein
MLEGNAGQQNASPCIVIPQTAAAPPSMNFKGGIPWSLAGTELQSVA